MAQGQQRNVVLVPGAAQALDQFKYEVAQELTANNADPGAQALQQWLTGATGGYGGNIPSRVWGAVGGHMVRRMIAAAEQALIQQATAQVRAGFQQAIQAPTGVQNPRTVSEQGLNPANV